MTPIYLYALFGSLIIPLLFSIFRIDFIKKWRNFTISTIAISIPFLIWDVFFTHYDVWGFNETYCIGFYLFKIPLEEMLFFLVIPFCSLFTHFAFFYAFPNIRLTHKTTIYLTIALLILSAFLVVTNLSKAYTAVNYSFLFITLLLGLIYGQKQLQQFYISFLIILIPFFIVNGILTGVITETPIVWYNNLENLGIRLITIPVEDIGYAFSMLFGNLLIFEKLNKQGVKQ
jgi:lycopene cyclase domain-containing protein